jgi:hypothetical protein
LPGEAIQAAKLAQASSAKQLRGRERARLLVLAKLIVKKSIVEAGAGSIGGAGAVVDGVERAQ